MNNGDFISDEELSSPSTSQKTKKEVTISGVADGMEAAATNALATVVLKRDGRGKGTIHARGFNKAGLLLGLGGRLNRAERADGIINELCATPAGYQALAGMATSMIGGSIIPSMKDGGLTQQFSMFFDNPIKATAALNKQSMQDNGRALFNAGGLYILRIGVKRPDDVVAQAPRVTGASRMNLLRNSFIVEVMVDIADDDYYVEERKFVQDYLCPGIDSTIVSCLKSITDRKVDRDWNESQQLLICELGNLARAYNVKLSDAARDAVHQHSSVAIADITAQVKSAPSARFEEIAGALLANDAKAVSLACKHHKANHSGKKSTLTFEEAKKLDLY